MNPAALIAAPLIASTFTLPPARGLDPADLWTAGVELTPDELSGLLEDCTGWTVEGRSCGADGFFYFLVDPCGDRDPWGFDDLADLADHVGWRIDEALADCAP
jgi:hypothetical protein